MARLPPLEPAETQRLDAWLKGPVYYDCDVRLRATVGSDSRSFALHAVDDERPAILGCWRRTHGAERLGAEDLRPQGDSAR
jgi:hypothetical protein